MDPNAALILLLEAIEAKDWELAEIHLDDLMGWIERGGFAPNIQAATETLWERMRDAG